MWYHVSNKIVLIVEINKLLKFVLIQVPAKIKIFSLLFITIAKTFSIS